MKSFRQISSYRKTKRAGIATDSWDFEFKYLL